MPAPPAPAPGQRLPEPLHPLADAEPDEPLRFERIADADRDLTIVTLHGDLDLDTGGQLRDALIDGVDSGSARVVADLSSAEFIGSRALGTLVVAARRASDRGAELHVVAAHPAVLRSMELTGLTGFLRVTPCLPDLREPAPVADSA